MTSIAQKASTSNSSQSNPISKWNFEVFLSFRGEDTRKGFTSHLYAALCREGIKTFMDDEELQRGEVISDKLCEAIKNSLYAIVVLSKDYASSSWCLNELEMILASKELVQVLPIFYNVDPSDVRHQKGSFAKAFTEHEKKYKDDQEKVKKWRESLTQVANLSGWDSKNWSEAQLIDTVVDKLWRKLHSKFPSYNAKLVGIDSKLDAINSLLKIEMNDVRFLGIWGMGGIGKTTLSRVVYGRLCKEFEICCYLDNIREISERGGGGHVFLQQELLSHFNVKGKMIENPDIGKERIRSLFNNKKVLLVLDDISSRDQLENLAGSRDWFGEGSRVIITTRNKHLLMSLGDHEIYEVQILNKEESLQLFSRNAFRSDKPKEDYLELSKSVVKYTGGLPLALQVLGSFLCGRGKPEWEDTLDKIIQGSDKEIDKILRISYEGLEDSQKIVFLDIACFFKLWRKDEVIEILKNCGLHPRIDVRVLIEKSLLTEVCIGDRMHLDMHDLVQQMGRSIVIQESPNASKRSRLWSPKDIHQVLKRNTGTELTHGVVLPKSYDVEAHWHPEAFLKMINLRLLIISYDLYIPNGLKCLSSALKVLHWYKYPLEALPLGTPLDELVYLKMHHSKVKQLWIGRQCLENLEHMDLSYSKFLIETPDFSEAPNLKTLILENCTNLVEIHQSLGLLKNLLVVNFKGCINLKFLPRKVEMNSLKEFVLHGCTQVRNLPEFGESMKNLGIIDLEETGIAKLPESLGLLSGLEVLNLRGCKNLVFLPHTIVNLKHLKLLDISGCSKFSRLPENLNEVEALEKLDASETAIIEIPSSIGHLQRLQKLLLSGCFFQVRHPSHKVLLPPSFRNLKSLTELNLSYNNIDDGDILDCLSSLSSLRKLNLSGNKFENLPAGCICNLLQLQFLYLTFCSKLQSLPQPSPSLLRIDAAACASMKPLSDEQLWNLFASIEENGHQDTGIGLRTSSFIEHFVVNFPGSEIPSWFVDQFEFFETSESEANSLIIDIPQSCCTREWLGFALCQILDKESDLAFHGWTLDCIKAVEGCKLERINRFKVLLDAHVNPPLLGIMFVKLYKKNLPKSLIDYNKLCLTYFSLKDVGLVKCGWRVIPQEDFELWAQSRNENDLSILEELKDRKCKRPLQLFPFKHRQGVFNGDRITRQGMEQMRASRSMVQDRQEYSPEIDQYFQLLRELADEIIMIAHRNFDSLISHINYLESIFQNRLNSCGLDVHDLGRIVGILMDTIRKLSSSSSSSSANDVKVSDLDDEKTPITDAVIGSITSVYEMRQTDDSKFHIKDHHDETMPYHSMSLPQYDVRQRDDTTFLMEGHHQETISYHSTNLPQYYVSQRNNSAFLMEGHHHQTIPYHSTNLLQYYVSQRNNSAFLMEGHHQQTIPYHSIDLPQDYVSQRNNSAFLMEGHHQQTIPYHSTDLPQDYVSQRNNSAFLMKGHHQQTIPYHSTNLPQYDVRQRAGSTFLMKGHHHETVPYHSTDLPQYNMRQRNNSALLMEGHHQETIAYHNTNLHNQYDVRQGESSSFLMKGHHQKTIPYHNIDLPQYNRRERDGSTFLMQGHHQEKVPYQSDLPQSHPQLFNASFMTMHMITSSLYQLIPKYGMLLPKAGVQGQHIKSSKASSSSCLQREILLNHPTMQTLKDFLWKLDAVKQENDSNNQSSSFENLQPISECEIDCTEAEASSSSLQAKGKRKLSIFERNTKPLLNETLSMNVPRTESKDTPPTNNNKNQISHNSNFRGGRNNRGGSNWSSGRGGRYSQGRRGGGHFQVTCQLCNQAGHSVHTCYYRFNHNFQVAQPPSQFQQFYRPPNHVSAAVVVPETIYYPSRYPDSGATNHVTADYNNMMERNDYNGGDDQLHAGNDTGNQASTSERNY